MKENVERSDPVTVPDGYRDVTPEQLDRWHTTCGRLGCQTRAKTRASAREATANLARRLESVTTALEDVATTAREASRVLGTHEEPLADWERELLGAIELERWAEQERVATLERRTMAETTGRYSALAAGLQHQRINPTFQ